MKSFDFKVYFITLASLVLLFFAVSFAQLPYLFENGEYAQYTRSILQDQDLNIVNQVKDPELNWIVTQTGNHAAHYLYGTAAYLLPFFIYQQMAEAPAKDVNDFLYAQALSTVFYLSLGLVLLWKVLSLAKVKNLGITLLILMMSTSMLWYVFFTSSTTNIFSTAFSCIAFAYVYLISREEERLYQFFVFGFILGLGLLIRFQLFWIGLVPIAFFLKDKRSFFKKSGLFVLGLLPMQAVSFANSHIRNGHIENLPILFFWKNFSLDLFLNSVKYSLWGPNGYLTVSPVYVAVLVAAFGCYYFFRSKKSDLVNVALLFLLAPAGILVAQSLIGQIQDCLAGRHLLTYFFIFYILVAMALSEISRCSRKGYWTALSLLGLAGLWNLMATGSFYYRDTVEFWRWNTSYQISIENALHGWSLFLSRAGTGWEKARHVTLTYFPLLILLSFALFKAVLADAVVMKKICRAFFTYGIVVLIGITGCNIVNNSKNVQRYTREGLYQGKVVVKSTEALIYDDFIEMNRMSMRYYAFIGRCDLAQKSAKMIGQFVEDILPDILIDPIHFKEDLSRGVLRRSGFEDQETVDALETEIKKNCPMLERNTY